VKEQRIRNAETKERIAEADYLFDADALTIGIGRRLADYKRSDWLLSADIARIRTILLKAATFNKKVKIVFCGKAHPKDSPESRPTEKDRSGQEIISRIHGFIKQLESGGIRGSIVFLENYNLDMAHYLEQAVDVWLSYPETDWVDPEAPRKGDGGSGGAENAGVAR